MIRVTKTRFLADSNLWPFNKMSHGFKKWPSIFWNRHRLLAPIVKNSKIRVMDARKKITPTLAVLDMGDIQVQETT